mmetsp:Transcript_29181/g.42821  ORF Transcript_29181/g.42821 Transcript_29181/m.42821 type:complete len:198 (-) Transcript_29181:261-854(-)|eukprot:CAMPEP_0116007732 /NCGR_PEP_ID=MMETSP0321-20121206/2463_1 /TAXON_ID=163516 /ORGANISM="Leptocylindrus danicus var. danicus, Strain B650" /LENGTH=197 /DNA_ID=CAMNT_0003476461 /DNA_START=68 /DNA_END=661 /DNA_ORIENTATION=+
MHASTAKFVVLISSFVAVNALVPTNRRNPSVDNSSSAVSTRRSFFKTSAASLISSGVFVSAATTQFPSTANASYSAYTNREKDWEKRVEKGEVKVSSARDLKAQLREIAPMNAQSEIFCPNGPSSNVSPMMENKCSDRQAMPSVYGRQDDIVGNSIPGFSKNYNFGSGAMLSGNVEFPDYGKSSAQENSRVNRNLIK